MVDKMAKGRYVCLYRCEEILDSVRMVVTIPLYPLYSVAESIPRGGREDRPLPLQRPPRHRQVLVSDLRTECNTFIVHNSTRSMK